MKYHLNIKKKNLDSIVKKIKRIWLTKETNHVHEKIKFLFSLSLLNLNQYIFFSY